MSTTSDGCSYRVHHMKKTIYCSRDRQHNVAMAWAYRSWLTTNSSSRLARIRSVINCCSVSTRRSASPRRRMPTRRTSGPAGQAASARPPCRATAIPSDAPPSPSEGGRGMPARRRVAHYWQQALVRRRRRTDATVSKAQKRSKPRRRGHHGSSSSVG